MEQTLKQFVNGNLFEACNVLLEKLGIKQADIDEFRNIMLTTDLADSIEEIIDHRESQKPNDDKIYDLMGRPVPVGAQMKGIYIQNGRKILVR